MRKAPKKGEEQSGACPDDPAVMETREEAEADLEDAIALAGTPGGGPMAVWHAGQAAEKFLRVLARTAGRQAPVLWDVARVFEAVRDLPAAADLAGAVETLVGALKERASESPLRPQTLTAAIESARAVRRGVLGGIGVEVPPDDPLTISGPRADGSARDGRPEGRPHWGHSSGPRPGGPRAREGRSDADRRTSYVRVFLLCDHCGVRIPRRQQTAHGRVPCPLCGRTMNLAS